MKKSIKSVIACLASICLISTFGFTAFAEDDNQTLNGPADVLDGVSDIADDIIGDVTTTQVLVTTTAAASETTYTTSSSYETTPAITTSVTAASEEVTTSVTTSSEEVTTSETTVTTNIVVPAYTNDIVIGLDISGSMDGEPMKAMKEAASEFIRYTLEHDPNAKISIVSFDDSASVGVSLTNDADTLLNYIDGLSTGGWTNFTSAFSEIIMELESGQGTRKNVVFMADGLPNDGKTDYSSEYKNDYPGYDEYERGALKYDNENVKTEANVYTVGFFHSLSGSKKTTAAEFMKDLASSDAQYFNADISTLKDVFASISEDIVVTEAVTTSAAENKSADVTTASGKVNGTPKTADSRNVAPLVTIACVAFAGAAISRKNKNTK